jgi:peptidoglycan hydrolase-like protein with peptidoglycan-binding domain
MHLTLLRVVAALVAPLGVLLALPATATAGEDQIHLSNCGLMLEGQTGTCISLLQLSLNETGAGYGLPVDGEFGPGTRTALLDFQGRNGLGADGNAGEATISALIGKVGDHSALDLGGPNPYPPANPAPTSRVLAEQCGPEQFASFSDYISGRVGPPRCFPYQPEIKDTKAGPRATDPFNDGCSGPTPLDRVPLVYDFRNACAAHDYAYDLLRYGVDTFREPDADNRLWSDWMADCQDRITDEVRNLCRTQATEWRAGVRFGNVEPGDPITAE